MIYLTHV